MIPQCTNCGSYGKECIYVDLPKKARPSSARIARLEQEVQRLRAQSQLRDVQPQNVAAESHSTPSSVNHSVHSVHDASKDMSVIESREVSVGADHQRNSFSATAPPNSQRQLVPPSDLVSYYGRTSALFEDGGPHQDARSTNNNSAGQVSERTQLMLMGEATRRDNVKSPDIDRWLK